MCMYTREVLIYMYHVSAFVVLRCLFYTAVARGSMEVPEINRPSFIPIKTQQSSTHIAFKITVRCLQLVLELSENDFPGF